MSLRTCIIPCILFMVVGLTSCSKNKTPRYNPDIGPFDEDGNYVEEWADNPPKRGAKLRRSEPAPPPKPAPRTAEAPKPVYKPAPKPKPKPVYKPAPKPKPKPAAPKPKTIRHTVKKGDTLYSMARKYGTTVSKIQNANGLRGTTIQTGKSYIIPR